MDIDIARHVMRTVFRCTHALGDLALFLSEHLDAKDYKRYSDGVASSVAAMQLGLMNRIIADHPELEAEFAARIEKYGQYL